MSVNVVESSKPVFINGRAFWEIAGRLIPAVHGASGTPPADPPPAEEEGDTKLDEKITHIVRAQISRAMKSSNESLTKSLTATLGEQIAKALEGLKPAAPAEGDKSAKPVADDTQKAVQHQLAELKRQVDEERAARKQVEDDARRDRTQGQLRAMLEAAKVRPELLDVAVGHLAKVSGALRYNEDGSPMLAVKRARSKGAAAEELMFDDLRAGVDDWIKSSEASAFLSPPKASTGTTQQNNSAPFNPNGRQGNRRSPLDDFLSQAAEAAAMAPKEP